MFSKLHPESDAEKFKAGTGWLKRFRDRHGVHSLQTQGESMSADTAAVAPIQGALSEADPG